MKKARAVLGLIAGMLLLLSSAAHMLLGWPGIRDQLFAAHAPKDLIAGLHVGWQFGGAAMIAFAGIVLWTFLQRLRGISAGRLPTAVIAAMYILFGGSW
jgi:hypothetical protein